MIGRKMLRILQAIGYEMLPVHPRYAMEQMKGFLTNLNILWAFVVKTSIFLTNSLWNLIVQLKWRIWMMMVVWGCGLFLFWYLEFGNVFLLGTGFALIFANLGDTRREGDMSAWVSINLLHFFTCFFTNIFI